MIPETAQSFVQINNPETQLPAIHLNGNSATLGNQYWKALNALRAFEEAFLSIDFHQHDYPLGDEAWVKAIAQRQAQWANIGSLRRYLDAHAAHCFEAAR